MTLEFNEPIVTKGFVYGEETWVYGQVGADMKSITITKDGFAYDPAGEYIAKLWIDLDVCDTSLIWSDFFDKISYVDDQNNSLDSSAIEEPQRWGIFDDNGACGEHDQNRGALLSKCLSRVVAPRHQRFAHVQQEVIGYLLDESITE